MKGVHFCRGNIFLKTVFEGLRWKSLLEDEFYSAPSNSNFTFSLMM
jgi:hypothetical protein